MTLSKIKRLTLLLFIAGGVVTGQTLEDIAIVDSETSYFLTLTFDEVPKYRTSEVYEPPSFTITFTGANWGKGDFARRVMTDPLYQYSIRIVTTSFGREDLELRLDFFSNTEIKINKSGDRKIIVSWEKFKDKVEVQTDTSFLEIKEMTALDALQQTVSLRFRNATIQDVVRLLFVSYGLNMILHPDLNAGLPRLGDNRFSEGNITLLLKDVTIEVALSLILKLNGYDWYLDNEIIIVKPLNLTLRGELVTNVYDLKFADGNMIASALGNGVLSAKGSSVAFTTGLAGSFNDKLMVTDIEANLPAVEKLINSLDQKTQQIHISVKFIETTLSADEHLGINWGLRADLVGPAVPDSSGLLVNIGHWNKLSMAQLTLPVFTSILQLLTTDNETRLLQEPQVTTFNNSPATINVGTSIPVLVPQTEGGVFGVNPYTFESVSVNINLQVTPRINAEGLISLAIDAQIQAIIGYVGPDADRPIVSTRSTQTNVRVADGRTLLIGGLILNDESQAVDKVPLLGNLPIIGKLFTNTVKKTSQRELLIFITPSIVS
jgi:type II secretory pathway component GspD/PulD (secretin)